MGLAHMGFVEDFLIEEYDQECYSDKYWLN